MIKPPKTGWVKLKYHRNLPDDYEIKTVTISQEPSGKWYISINVEYEKEIPVLNLDENNSIGLDYSSHDFHADNQGIKANYPKFYRKLEERLVFEQRKLSNMEYQSNNWYKQKKRVDIIHEKIKNSRLDFCHKLSYDLANKYDYVFVEDINLQNIAQSLKLGKSTNDNGFGMFRTFLQYKLEDRGKQLIKIDKWFPSSKTCSKCGCINSTLGLKDREWICPDCGSHHDRDVNSAVNIRNEGIRLVKKNRRDYGDSSLILDLAGVLEREAPKLQLSV